MSTEAIELLVKIGELGMDLREARQKAASLEEELGRVRGDLERKDAIIADLVRRVPIKAVVHDAISA